MATMGGAKSLGMEDVIGSITPGKKADLLLIKNDESPAMTPILNPYAHVVYQAGTADVHTVVVNGRVVKYDGKRIGLPLAPIARQGRGLRRVRAFAARRRTVVRRHAPRGPGGRGDREPLQVHGGRRPRHRRLGGLMILHLAMFTWRDDVTAADVAELTSQLETMAARHPGTAHLPLRRESALAAE